MEHFSEEEKNRRKKLEDLYKKGFNPYRNDLKPSHSALEFEEAWMEKSREELDGVKASVSVSGRIMAFRHFGKAAFVTLKDRTGRAQAYVAASELKEEQFSLFKTFDVGDFIYVKGTPFRTKTDQLSIRAIEVHLLTKSLRPLPEKFHGLTDVEQKYRMRYVDLIMNENSRAIFETRSKIIHYIRKFFHERNYLEVETPMMQAIAGGAAARPFSTYHNALDMKLYLRIAPELYLKRLVVGGIEKVFEINRNFRNEGISVQHNPEFTMLEFYEAYATYEDLMSFTEEMFSSLVKELFSSTVVSYQGEKIDFSGPWKRMTMLDAIREMGDIPKELLSKLDTKEGIIEILQRLSVEGFNPKHAYGYLLEFLFEERVEKKLIHPTFITAYPRETSFLSRANEKNPNFVDRFELFIYGREIANGFSELNDPIDQRKRFEQQAAQKAGGDEEACDVDEDYLRSLEYGMPPTGGEGIGIDRLVMLLTDQASIRDVILFPHMRSEKK